MVSGIPGIQGGGLPVDLGLGGPLGSSSGAQGLKRDLGDPNLASGTPRIVFCFRFFMFSGFFCVFFVFVHTELVFICGGEIEYLTPAPAALKIQ